MRYNPLMWFLLLACGPTGGKDSVPAEESPKESDSGDICTTIWYSDADADGFGDAAASASDCSQPVGFVANSADCDDGNPNIHPGAAEIPRDLVDQDCNGQDECVDLTCDGKLDIVVSITESAGNPVCESRIYPGSAEATYEAGPGLVTEGALGNSVADVNNDGWPDIVFANSKSDSTDHGVVIYYGAPTNSFVQSSYLPASGARGVAVADLNADAWPELLVANAGAGTDAVDSLVYWGSADGFSVDRQSRLPSVGAYGITAADLDGDGYKEVVISNYGDGSTMILDSYLYWGSAEGYSVDRRSLLPSMGATGNAIADLDGDGLQDIVIANSSDGTTAEVPSWIYWGNSSWSAADRTELPTLGAEGVSLQDLDADGYVDVVVSGGDPQGQSPVSYVFWGSTTRYSDGDHIELATVGSVGNAVSDLDGDGWKDLIFAGSDTAQVWWGPSWPYGEPVSLPGSAHSFGISALALEQGL